MVDHDRRDESIERLLPQVFEGASGTPAPGDHLDAETAAAWMERTLEAGAAKAAEVHLSSCARCQDLMTTLARITPTPAAPEPWWHAWRWQWLVPIGAAAAAVALWVAGPSPTTSPAPESQQAHLEDSPLARPEAEPTPTAAPEPTLEASQAQERFALRVGARATGGVQPGTTVPSAPTAAGALTAQESRVEAKAEADQAPTSAERLRQPTALAEAAAPAAAPPATAGAPPAASDASATSRAVRGVAVNAAPSPLRRAALSERTVGTDIVATGSTSRWRILAGGERVQFSADGGATWTPVTVPASSGLVAGFAPSSGVCWIVGRAGVVLLTTDGGRFSRLAFPDSSDLVAVRATDARGATVTTATGQAFRTTDGGATWTRVP